MTGQLGRDVMLELLKRGHTAFGSGSRDMKIFVTGVGGQLGHNVVNDAVGRGHDAIGSDIAAKYSGVQDGSAVVNALYIQLDITNQAAVAATIEKIRPDAIIHCAAWTAVDAAEDEENKAKVYAINVEGTRLVSSGRCLRASTRGQYLLKATN